MSTPPANRFVPLSKAAHAQLRWLAFQDWLFTANEILVPLTGVELGRAAGNYPVVFVRAGERVEMAAVLGLRPGGNLFVNAAGQWLADYTPASLRGRPFALGMAPGGQAVLCVDETSPLLVREGDAGEPMFTPEGELAPGLQKTAEFLKHFGSAMHATWKACDALWRHNCLEPLKVPDSVDTPLKQAQGLYQVNEAALRALPANVLAELMALGAVGVAYMQMVSLNKLPLLGKMDAARAAAAAPAPAVDLSVLDRDGTLVLGPLG